MSRPHRFTVLLGMIVFLVLFTPVARHLPGSGFVFPILGTLIPLGAIYAVSEDPRHARIALALGIPAALAGALNLAGVGLAGEWIALFFPPAFYAYAVWVAASKVFSAREINADMLAGAACIYLLIGMTWWFFYLLLVTFQPDAIAGYEVRAGEPGGGFALLYFSFVTLTTLGYGDLLPTTGGAQSLVILEAVTGVLYSAILVAKLVGLYAGRVDR